MALTQVVEHHLPTYASLAFVEQKWECKKLERNQKKMKMHHAENATQNTSFIIEPIVAILECINSNARLTWRYSLGSIAIPVSFCFGALAGQSSCTTSDVQATIKGWWWLRTTLWCDSG